MSGYHEGRGRACRSPLSIYWEETALAGATMKRSRPKPPPTPADRPDTLRREIVSVLSGGPLTAREISGLVGISEKDVLAHLEHVRIALRGGLLVTPAECMSCGFVFAKRERLKAPGKCPVCRSEHIAEPSFSLG
jgi:transcriptional regulator